MIMIDAIVGLGCLAFYCTMGGLPVVTLSILIFYIIRFVLGRRWPCPLNLLDGLSYVLVALCWGSIVSYCPSLPNKGMANLLEIFYLGAFLGVIQTVRMPIVVFRPDWKTRLSVVTMLTGLVAAAVLPFVMPNLGE